LQESQNLGEYIVKAHTYIPLEATG
jgi:hypothetical protein